LKIVDKNPENLESIIKDTFSICKYPTILSFQRAELDSFCYFLTEFIPNKSLDHYFSQ